MNFIMGISILIYSNFIDTTLIDTNTNCYDIFNTRYSKKLEMSLKMTW